MRAALLMLAGLAFLAGCATPKSADLPPISSWEQRTAVLGATERWDFKARIAVRTGDEGFNGKLRWAQRADDFDASVSGPLGIGTVRIEGSQRQATLTDKDGVRTTLADIDAELQLRYGWTLPMSNLRYWVLGIPHPDQPADTRFAEDGQLSELTQGGWSVTISRYSPAGGQLMPSRLTAENGQTRVRLVIDHWVFFE